MIQTKNFNPKSDPKLLCTCGHSKCDKRSVNQGVLNGVQLIRNDAGRPLTINSGGRCQWHPNERKRVNPADHQKCNAVDISVMGGIERGQIVKLAIEHGFNSIGVGDGFVHVGIRAHLADGEVIMWTY